MGKSRIILEIVLGYIIGIIWGLYLDISIVLLYTILFLIIKIISFTRIYKYIKLIIKQTTIIIIIVTSLISNLILINQNKKYEKLFHQVKDVKIIGKVIDNGIKKQYTNRYIIKIEKLNNKLKYKSTYVYLEYKGILKYGDLIYIKGKFQEPDVARNFKGFNYKDYLKTLKIYGTVKGETIQIINKQQNNIILTTLNNIFLKIKNGIETNLDKNTSSILLGVLLGYTDDIDEEIKENFSESNISHILAVSGMHISYIVIGISFVLGKILGKRFNRIITIALLIIYMSLTGFSPSVVRASIMSIIFLISKILYRKNDIWTSISLSLLILLIFNPFLIKSMSVQFTYIATIGIIILQRNILHFFKNIKIRDSTFRLRRRKITNGSIANILNPIFEILAVSFSAQIAILPISIMSFNTFNIIFFITNFFISFIIPPIIILGIIVIIFIILGVKPIYFIIFILKIFINILIEISKIGSKLPFSNITITTPSTWNVLIYYVLIIIANYLYSIWHKNKLTTFEQRVKNLVYLIKYTIRRNQKKILKISIIFLIIFALSKFLNKDLEIYFIDVGQGDSTLAITPNNKKILIDGGGSESYNVGKNILIPYLLDRKIKKIDYIIISHFDSDHVDGLLTIMKEIEVKCVIIGKQFESCNNYEEFIKIVKDKNTKVHVVEEGQRIKIENNLYFDILWPSSNDVISANSINNNSLVCKLLYQKFSILFTGDIEEIAEKAILEKYKGTNVLQSTILKVAHHGSKSSSKEEFLNAIKPKIALIGVGEKNTFGHPNAEVLERIERRWK